VHRTVTAMYVFATLPIAKTLLLDLDAMSRRRLAATQ
jgi:hypothetical protein